MNSRLLSPVAAGLGIVLVAASLRTGISSAGAALPVVRGELRLSDLVTNLVISGPLFCFALMGLATHRLTRWLGTYRLLVAVGLVLTIGLTLRALSGSALVFLVTSFVALAGVAAQNVLLPVLVREHFPHRIGLVTGLYNTALSAVSALAAAVAVPLADTAFGWRLGLGVWALPALLALLPWLPVAWRTGGQTMAPAVADAPVRPARTGVGWALMLCFGAQGINFYVLNGWLPSWCEANGYAAGTAGTMLSVALLLGLPVGLVLPALAVRPSVQRGAMVVLAACYLGGYLLLGLAGHGYSWVAVVLVGVGTGFFPLMLSLIAMRARTTAGAAALSGFVQGVGYLVAALGLLAFGFLHSLTGGWRLPMVFLVGVVLAQAVLGWIAARPRCVEDPLPGEDRAGSGRS
ncbi:MFS transporter [Amycolatopsis silviterrae]|uniref:CynX/NimT family MFS transporter n=1 Tax=Amycolatopsis silviterrae TaxID=1656914 RepID=A0ABW5H4L7_9PSEU